MKILSIKNASKNLINYHNVPKKIKKSLVMILSMGIATISIPMQNILINATSESDVSILEEQLDMPILSITSSNSISSKDAYVDASISIYDENGVSELQDTSISIRLRGNSTLNASKRSYKIKFENKQNLLQIGDGKGKTWNLVANAYDTSLLRNSTAYNMANMFDNMPYNPNCKSVEVYLNGSYQGVYLLCEAINVNKNRVNIAENINAIEDTGYLIEMTRYAEENYFDIALERYEVKSDLSEDTSIKEQQIEYISNYMQDCYNAVLSGEETTINQLIDVNSLVDIYIASEIVKNVDAGWDSFYLFKNANGKLTFGPM